MSEAVVAAVARALFRELHICDLPTFACTFEHDAAAVINVLQSDACRAAADEAVSVQSAVADRHAAQLAQADERAAEAERRQAEAEERCAAAEARGPVRLSLQIHPQLRHGGMVHAHTQTPLLKADQASVSTQAPSPQIAAFIAKQQRQELQLVEERARERARVAMVPALERGVAAAEAAERAAAQQWKDAQRMLEAVRPTAERAAREAAAAAAD